MPTGFRCPECGAPNRLFDAMNDSVLAITRELRLVDALQRIVDAARQLVGARFAAVGVPGEDGRFAAWVASGGGEDADAPRVEGVLEYVLRRREPWSTADLGGETGVGAWPAALPVTRSLLAVPITAEGDVLGAFYLGNEDGWGFSPEDQRMIELVAPHAAVAIANARLHARSRELSVVKERNRLARELHDSVTQSLFSMRLAADTALALAGSDPDGARAQIEQLRELAGGALAEMRALVAELRPPAVEASGIVETLRGHVEVLRQVHRLDVRLDARLPGRFDAAREAELFRVAQEALSNAVRHSGAGAVDVLLEPCEGGVRLTVRDDGRGFDPGATPANGCYGLTSMRERAQALGAHLEIASAAGEGTTVRVEVPA